MTRTTIDFGIDLGTTNSEIAVFKGAAAEIIKNNENFENTPSAVWIDARGREFVGKRAREQQAWDPDNAKIQFKLQMGNAEPILFKDSGKKLLPEELSAKVLLQLKANVKQWLGEDISAAVITVPADFLAPQIEATNRAARLAGLETSPLVHEPVAAAIAYDFQRQVDDSQTRWLIYDLGGGTFDAALVRKREGIIAIENHAGNRRLGGTEIDNAIVDALLVPALLKQARLSNFSRGNAQWIKAFAKLKIAAEEAKIALSRGETADLDLRDLCKDDHGQPVDFDYELRRAELEPLAEPVIAKSIHICRAMLQESRLNHGDIEKLILVGGPTLMPYLRERLADKSQGLGIPLEFGVDPFTVVARGAAIFAGTQPLLSTAPIRVGEYQVKLDYQAIGPDEDPVVSGQVVSAKAEDLSGYTIEFINRAARPPWRSGKLGLSPDGSFLTTLRAEKGVQNTFVIELADAKGSLQKTTPQSFPYTFGPGIGPQILTHDIGVALRDNTVLTFFTKGTPVPARTRKVLATTSHARRGSSDVAVSVPVVEGKEKRADRNEIIGVFRISAIEFARDVPAGSEIEVRIEADPPSYLTKVYIPILDEEFETTLVGTTFRFAADELLERVEKEKKRLAELRVKVEERDEPRAKELLRQIDMERLAQDLEAALTAARIDPDASDRCASRLHDLQVALDAIEETLKWPDVMSDAERRIDEATRIVQKYGSVSDKDLVKGLIREVQEAIEQREAGLVHTRAAALSSFAWRIYRETDEYLVGMLSWLEDAKPSMPDQAEASAQFARANRAMNANDRIGLRSAISSLLKLLPEPITDEALFSESTLMRSGM